MRRLFNILISSLAMLAVALLSAFITLRLAIHGREVEVPDLSGQTIPEAIDKATQSHLNLTVENRFYSTTTPAGRVLSQLPAPGSKVRRDWTVRIAESLGPQRVSVPNVVGQPERTAAVTIRRLSLDLGTVAYIPAPGPAGIVLTQSPTPAAAGIDGPRISLLVSEPEPSPRRRPVDPTTKADQATTPDGQTAPSANQLPGETSLPSTTGTPTTPGSTTPATAGTQTAQSVQSATQPNPQATAAAADPNAPAFVMPNLIGLSLSAASARVASMGLHIASVDTQNTPIRRPTPIPSIQSPGPITGSGPIRPPAPIAPIAPVTLANTVIAQSPISGRRVTKNDAIHITLSH
jgi:beta-lactam-binding protein with PASTA domain